MPGLGPRTHVLLDGIRKDVGGRANPGHDTGAIIRRRELIVVWGYPRTMITSA